MNWKKDSEFTYIPVTSVEKDRDRRMRAAYFTDFIDSLEMEQKRLEKVKKASGTDHLVAVMSGTYLQNGQPARENMASRMEKARQVALPICIPACPVSESMDTVHPICLPMQRILTCLCWRQSMHLMNSCWKSLIC